MSDNETLRIIGDVEIAKLSLAPGDVLVIRLQGRVTDDVQRRVQSILKSKLPEGVNSLVIDSAVDISVLSRAEIEAKAA